MSDGRVAGGRVADVRRLALAQCLEEIGQGVGREWHKYRVLGATRAGIAPAKEGVGQAPERYKLVQPETIFYNPMRILLGSIAVLEEGEEPGITSPDYVVLRTRPGLLHFRWFYYWLRSSAGNAFIRSLARGAVRERMLFRRLAVGEIEAPSWEQQVKFASRVVAVERARVVAESQLQHAKALPVAYLRATFSTPEARRWARTRLGEVCELLPSKSIATDGDTEVYAITTACLAEGRFLPSGVKPARMWARDVPGCMVLPGEVLVARSNTPDLVGRVAMFGGVPNSVVASDLTIRIRPDDRLSSEFLTRHLSFLYATGYWKDRAGGASGSMKKITRGQILAEYVPVPPLSEQEPIVAMVNEQMAEVERLQRAAEDQVASINALSAALLRRAFTGEL